MKDHRHGITAALCALCIGGLVSTSNSYAQDATSVDATDDQPAATTASTPPPIPAAFIKMIAINEKYNKLNPWDWSTATFPPIGDTVDPELGGIRDALAKKNIGVQLFTQGAFYYNLANPPLYGADGPQNPPYNNKYGPGSKNAIWWYEGQKPTYYNTYILHLTWSNPKTNTQLVITGWEDYNNFFKGQLSNTPKFDAYINQYLFRKKLLITAGYSNQGFHYLGFFTAGNLAGSLIGSSAVLQDSAGGAAPFNLTPAINLRYQTTKNTYVQSMVQSSVNPDSGAGPNAILPLAFAPNHAKAFLGEEVGYNRAAAPGQRRLWARMDFFYNFSHYKDFRDVAHYDSPTPTRTSNNWAFSAAADYQTSQTDQFLPFRGNYIGGTIQYAPPQQNLFSQYYEVRDYIIGPFKRRPMDMISIIVNHMAFSKYWTHGFAPLLSSTGTYSSGQQNFSATYVLHALRGIVVSNAFEYSANPTPAPKTPNAFVYTGGVTMFF